MGGEHPEHRYNRARLAYVQAARQLNRAMNRWIDLEVPLGSTTGKRLPGWTKDQYDATVTAAAAWQDLVRCRQAYHSAVRVLREGPGL